MESDDKTADKDGTGKSRKRKEPRPPLQPEEPAEEGAPAPARGIAEGMVKRVAEIMTENPVCCLPGTPLVKVARLMAENSCGAIPVIRSAEDRTPAGMVTDRDVAVRSVAMGRNPSEMTAGDVMSPAPDSVKADDSVRACADTMRERNLRRILVLDGAGRVCGLVALADLARHPPHGRDGGRVKDSTRPPSST